MGFLIAQNKRNYHNMKFLLQIALLLASAAGSSSSKAPPSHPDNGYQAPPPVPRSFKAPPEWMLRQLRETPMKAPPKTPPISKHHKSVRVTNKDGGCVDISGHKDDVDSYLREIQDLRDEVKELQATLDSLIITTSALQKEVSEKKSVTS